MPSSYVEAARAFATRAHAGQQYGREPYTVHLEAVARVLRELGVEDENLLAAAFLHDVLEDTPTTADDLLRAGFRPETTAWVGMVTNEPGANRRERAARTYPKIRRDPQAVLLKLGDRIANAEASRASSSSLFEMYRREHAGFAAALRRPGEWEEAWARLSVALGV